MSKARKLLIALIAGGVAVAGGAGTFASFTASTTNAASTFETGTLVLSNQKNTASACLSTNGGSTDTNANGCDQAFALTVQKPGQTATVNITLKNEGSIDGSALKGFASQACAAADASGQTYHGTGNPCGSLQVYVQEFSDSARTTPSTCRYGGGTATTCAYSAAKTLTDFGTSYPDANTSMTLGATTAGTSRYLTIGVQMDSAAGNSVQGRQATFGFSWTLVQ
jgi:hypothetical protein